MFVHTIVPAIAPNLEALDPLAGISRCPIQTLSVICAAADALAFLAVRIVAFRVAPAMISACTVIADECGHGSTPFTDSGTKPSTVL